MKFGSEALATTQTASPSVAPRAQDPSQPASAAPGDAAPSSATQICNPKRYSILGEHGRGAKGCVSRAHDHQLGRDIAIKELISRGALDEVRFMREALITARLEHPGIVPVYEAGCWPDGTPFYAMKLVAGRSLRDLLAERKTVDERIPLLHHVIAVADAIAYAHGRNIIHRDLKPANVVVGDFGETVVIDWGLAKDLTAGEEPGASGGPLRVTRDDDLTATGSVIGTPAYMSPEQRRGEPVDQRADVFAIGAMLWELCALQRTPPASAPQRRRVLRRTGIDRDLVAIIDKAVDPDPARRYPDAGALASDLKAFKAGARIAGRHYSLLAMLVHWTFRHRAIATVAAAAIVLVLLGNILYVRSIAAERDRADQERDRAQLSEASALIEQDPSRARSLLASLTVRSPQYALLMSRAKPRAATRIMSGLPGVVGLFRTPGTAELALVTRDGELYRVDPHTGTRRLIDRGVGQAVTYRAGDWLYPRKSLDAETLSIATPSKPQALNALGLTGVSSLVSLRDSVYALDAQGDLYRLSSDRPVLVQRRVHQVAAGDGSTLLVCSQDGTLEALHDGAALLHKRCLRNASPGGMAVSADDYATMTDTGTLIVSRRGRVMELPTAVSGEYELALSSAGVVALAGYEQGGSTWFVRPDGSALERGPAHGAPTSVAASGRFAAWGYFDGTVIAVETTTGAAWEFKGHPTPVDYIVIDDDRGTLVSASTRELRAWNLAPPPVTQVGPIPCRRYRIQTSPDGTRVALGCLEGGVWAWSRTTGAIAQLHRHVGQVAGVHWLGSLVCSGSWDGKVFCTTIDGKTTRTFDANAGRIYSMTGSPDASFLVLGTNDGRIWKLDSDLHPLYSQQSVSTQVALSPDGRWLASSGLDGSLVVFDLAENRVVSRVIAHRGPTFSLAWWQDMVLTSGTDGTLRWWSLAGDGLQLRDEVHEAAPVRFIKTFTGGWAYGGDSGILAIGRTGSAPIRLELAKPIHAIDVSPDMRYVAASVAGEVIVADLRDDRLATLAIDTANGVDLSFVDASSLALVSATGLTIVHVNDMDYERF